jgi:hypothetical protein
MVKYDDRVVGPEESYKGMPYGDWVARWTNWVFSDDPDSTEVLGDVLFLRGNLKYSQDLAKAEGTGLFMAGEAKKSVDRWGSFLDRTGEASIVISDDTAIFVPVLTSTEFLGGASELGTMTTEEQVRNITRIATDESGPIWATIESSDGKGPVPLCGQNLRNYRIASSIFKLWVSERNPYWKYIFQYPISPGEYDAVTDGFFILLRSLPEGSYRIRFGGKGRLDYRTDSVYDIHVSAAYRRRLTVTDISGRPEQSVWKDDSSVLDGIPKRSIPRLMKFRSPKP